MSDSELLVSPTLQYPRQPIYLSMLDYVVCMVTLRMSNQASLEQAGRVAEQFVPPSDAVNERSMPLA
jgi:hypothetical protein